MTDKPYTKETMCRFCLCSDDLIPFSEAITTAFDFEDVVHYTGIEMARDENVVVCQECCSSINESKNFRLTCIRNDSVFKRLVCFEDCTVKSNRTVICDASNDAEREIQQECTAKNNITVTCDAPKDGELEIQEECTAKSNTTVTCDAPKDGEREIQETKTVGTSKNHIRLLGNSESDDSSPLSGQPVADETNDTEPCNVIENPAGPENDTSNDNEQTEIEKEEDIDSYYSMFLCALYGESMQEVLNDESSQESLHGEGSQESLNDEGSQESFDDEGSQESCDDKAVQESSNAKLINETDGEKSAERSTENNEEGQTAWINKNRETATNWSKRKRSSSDASDSDDSITSLYSEWEEKLTSNYGISPIDYGFSNPFRIEGDVRSIKYRSVTINTPHVDLCSYCGLTTKKLKDHVQRTHCKEKKFECPHCQKKFPGTFHLKAHINTWHERSIIFTCSICGKGFVNQGSYTYHMTNKHLKRDMYECETCHRKLRSWDGYKKHLKEHSLTALKCQDCGRLYQNRVTLEKHKVRYRCS